MQLELTPIGASNRRFRAAVSEDAEINQVLAHHLGSEYGLDLNVDEYQERLSGALSHKVLAGISQDLGRRCSGLPGFEVDVDRVILANLS